MLVWLCNCRVVLVLKTALLELSPDLAWVAAEKHLCSLLQWGKVRWKYLNLYNAFLSLPCPLSLQNPYSFVLFESPMLYTRIQKLHSLETIVMAADMNTESNFFSNISINCNSQNINSHYTSTKFLPLILSPDCLYAILLCKHFQSPNEKDLGEV